jgi:HD-like signal output (HDOD) protein/GGDEF domain-containing protein
MLSSFVLCPSPTAVLATLNTLSFIVDRATHIHSLPSVAIEVLELTNQPRVDCQKIKACIERDPALVARILRVVNSSLFGLSSEVKDLNQAVALLGVQPLKLLVLGFSLSDSVFHGTTGDAIQHAWRHALTRAAAREICELVWKMPGDEVFIAGLLAELGKFVLLDELGESYAQLLTAAVTDHDNLCGLEQAALGFDHLELTAELLARWGLPGSIVAAIRSSASRERLSSLELSERRLPAAVALGGRIADLIVDERFDALHYVLRELMDDLEDSPSDFDALRLSDDQLNQVVSRVQERIGSLAGAFRCELPAGQDYRDILVTAQRRLALLAADAACVVARQLPIAEKRGAEVAGVSTALARYVTRNAETPARIPAPPRTVAGAARDSVKLFDSRLLDRLTTVVSLCRQARCPLSLVLVELDRFRPLVLSLGPIEAKRLVQRLLDLSGSIEHPGSVCIPLTESRLALVIADCDRRTALAIAQQLSREAGTLAGSEIATATSPTLSIGVATVSLPSKNFPPADLQQAADRCLEAARLSGGKAIKSIDVY